MPSVQKLTRKTNGLKDFQSFGHTVQDKHIPCAIFPIQYFRGKSGTYGHRRVSPPGRLLTHHARNALLP